MTRNKSYWDSIANQYDYVYQSIWSKHEDSEIESWLYKFLGDRKNISLLDLGCGTGLGFELCNNICSIYDYCGVDISSNMLEIADRRISKITAYSKVSLQEADVKSFLRTVPTNHYDAVISMNASCSYIFSSRFMIAESIRVTKPKGFIFLSFLNRYSLRRIFSFKFSIRELNKSRGFKLGSTPAITIRSTDILNRIPKDVFSFEIIGQSLLGGTIEHKIFIPIEKFFQPAFHQFGHTINALIIK